MSTEEESKNKFSRLASIEDMLYEAREMGKTENGMRMPKFNGITGQARSDPYNMGSKNSG